MVAVSPTLTGACATVIGDEWTRFKISEIVLFIHIADYGGSSGEKRWTISEWDYRGPSIPVQHPTIGLSAREELAHELDHRHTLPLSTLFKAGLGCTYMVLYLRVTVAPACTLNHGHVHHQHNYNFAAQTDKCYVFERFSGSIRGSCLFVCWHHLPIETTSCKSWWIILPIPPNDPIKVDVPSIGAMGFLGFYYGSMKFIFGAGSMVEEGYKKVWS